MRWLVNCQAILYGVTITRNRASKLYALRFKKDGVVCGHLSDGRKEQGLWWVDNNGLVYSQWPSWHAGAKIQLRYYMAPQRDHLIEVTKDGRYGLMLMAKGNPERLCEMRWARCSYVLRSMAFTIKVEAAILFDAYRRTSVSIIYFMHCQ